MPNCEKKSFFAEIVKIIDLYKIMSMFNYELGRGVGHFGRAIAYFQA
jgi:hypothetical protein